MFNLKRFKVTRETNWGNPKTTKAMIEVVDIFMWSIVVNMNN